MATIDWSKIYKKYKGLWVALAKDEVTVLASGKTAKEAWDRALRKGYQKPIMTRMPERLIPFVGTSDFRSELNFWDYLSDEALAKSGM